MNPRVHHLSDHLEFLQTAGEKFALGLSEGLQDLLRQSVLIKPAGSCLLSPSQYLLPASEPSCCFLLGVGPISAKAVRPSRPVAIAEAGRLELSSALANILVECLLGGTPQSVRPRPALTMIDRRVLRGVIEQVGHELSFVFGGSGVWMSALEDPLPPLEKSPAIRITFDVRIGPSSSQLHLALLQSALQNSIVQGSYACDGRCAHVSVCVDEKLESMPARLESGDMLATNIPPEGEVLVRVDGEPRFFGKLGQINGHRAVTLTRKIEPPAAPDAPAK